MPGVRFCLHSDTLGPAPLTTGVMVVSPSTCMRIKPLIWLTLFVGAIVGGVLFGTSRWATRSPLPSLAGVTNIVFTYRGNEDKPGVEEHFSVAAPEEVRRLVSLLRIVGTFGNAEPMCAHCFGARFQKPSGTVEISFHNHCLALWDASATRMKGIWPIPKGFYTEFYKLARTRTTWRIPEFEQPGP